jgi:sugar phosphate permease
VGVTNAVALGLGVGVGFALSLARLALWLSPLKPTSRRAKAAVMLATTLLVPAGVAFTTPTIATWLLVWLGTAIGVAVSTPVVLPLAHRFLGGGGRKEA